MNELPIPTLALSPVSMPRGSLHLRSDGAARALVEAPAQPHFALKHPAPAPQRSPASNGTATATASSAGTITTVWARHQDEVRAAQRLRHQVFCGEMGAALPNTVPGHDVDIFDDFCEHLLVLDNSSGEVIGTYRVLTPAQAKRIGSTYSDTEFDLTRLRGIRERMVELGRSCVHREHRHGGVIMALWGALAGFMVRNQLDIMVGCASVPMVHQGPHGTVGGGHAAASIWRQLKDTHLATPDLQVRPRLPLPIERLDSSLAVAPPALIKGYLRLGAKVLGPPAWDPDFNSADLPMMMRISDLSPRHRKHFLGQ